MKKKLIIALAIVISIYGYAKDQGIAIPGLEQFTNNTNTNTNETNNADSILQNAYNNKQSDLQVRGQGVVIKLLADDREGSKHQRFVLKLGTGQTVLVAHNIDLAPRINQLSVADKIEFYGEYEWQEKGGVIHWTHHDPAGRHVGGWLKHNGKTYQ